MNSEYDNLVAEAENLYDEHVDSFTYMMETPYTFHYFCEMYCNELYEEYLTLKEKL